MQQRIEDVDWTYGVWIRQAVPISEQNLPENFKMRAFSIQNVTKIDGNEFPIEQFRDRSELVEWIEYNLGQMPNGIYYIHGFGNCYTRKDTKRSKVGRWKWRKKKREYKFNPKLRRYRGIIALAKFELVYGKANLISKRRREKTAPYQYTNYPIMNWLKA